MYLVAPVLRAASLVDTDAIHRDIMSTLPSDPSIAKHFSSPIPPDSHWLIDAEGLLRLDNCIYVPNSNDLRLQILCYKHDHLLSRHFGQNQTLELVCRDYTWLGICAFVKDYVSSCASCAHCRRNNGHARKNYI